MNLEDAGQRCQAKFEDRRQRAEEAVAALPPAARHFLEQWRAEIERAGRQGPTGCCCDSVRRFAEGLRRVVEPGKTLDLTERGTGA